MHCSMTTGYAENESPLGMGVVLIVLGLLC